MNAKLLEYKEVRKWLTGKPEGTKKVYLGALTIYCEYRKLNPKELIDEIEQDREKSRREQGEVEFKLKEFYEWLSKEKEKEKVVIKRRKKKIMVETKPVVDERGRKIKGVSPKRANLIISAIRSFYKANGFPIINLKLPRASALKRNHKLQLRAEHVKKLVEHAPTLRDKAIILMLFQSGMDVSTLISLNYGDVARGLENNEEPLAIHVVRKKAGTEYVTFIGRDAINALKAYLNKRKQRQGKIGLNEPLFTKERERNGEKRINRALIDKMLKETAILSGLISREEMENADMNPCRPHALRTAFATIMKLQGVNNEIVEYWMGHTLPYEATYLIPTIDEMRKIYAEKEEALSIYPSEESIKALKEEMNGKLLDYNDILLQQKKEIDRLKKELEESKSLVDRFIKELLKHPEKAKRLMEVLASIVEEEKKKE
ncbi:MAG TPA: integrase [Thermoplasmata archaeon]|nr:integrase [Thermoplasmata archaeon]